MRQKQTELSFGTSSVLFAVAVMILSSMTLGGVLAATVERGGPAGQFDPGVGGERNVQITTDKPVVFQGEDGLNFVNAQGNPINVAQLVGVAGNAEGQPLESPIPTDQPPGQYAVNGQASQPGVTVQTPRVTDLDVRNERGINVEGSSVQEDELLLIEAEWNFEFAEDLELVVRDENGNDVTGTVLGDVDQLSEAQRQRLSGPFANNPDAVSNPGQRGTGTGVVYLQGVGQFNQSQLNGTSVDAAYWALDVSDLDAGDYTITVQGWDNLDFGPASRTSSLSVTTETDVSLDLDSDQATRGQNVGYTIRGSTAGAEHYVVIERDEFRNDRVDQRVFRDIQDVIDRGTFDTNGDNVSDFAWAQVQIDEDTGLGVGQIDTAFLDDASIEVDLFEAGTSLEDVAADLSDTEDDKTLQVEQGELVFTSPVGTYVAGSEIDVRGDAAPGVDSVAIYARDQGDWELVDINEDGNLNDDDAINVDSAGEWEEEDVVLSQATDIFSIPGRYRIGVVEAEDARGDANQLRETLTTSEFSSATSSQSALLVQEPGLEEARSFRTINAQIAVEDGTVDVLGTAPGLDDVLVIMVDSRGRVATEQVTVDDDDTFDEEDIPLVTQDGRQLNEGAIEGLVIGLGRDGVAGDGILPGQTSASLAALESYVNTIGTGLTQAQVLDRISDETTDEVASDDLSIQESFRLADGSTSIESVGTEENLRQGDIRPVPVNSTMVVQGLTNRKPDDNTISVEVIEGPSVDVFDVNSTDEWGLDGVWSVSLSTQGVQPGTYVIEADDGDNTDTVQVNIVEEQPEEPAPVDNETAAPDENVTEEEPVDANATEEEPVDANATEEEPVDANATEEEPVDANATEEEPVEEEEPAEAATVSFSDQESDGTRLVVDSVTLPEGGFIAIHDESLLEGEVVDSVVGSTVFLEPGTSENVSFRLFDVPGATFNQTELTEDQTLIAMPHLDTNNNVIYDFVASNGTDDGPYVANGEPVTDAANVTVNATG
ncbi:HVO_2072 family ArtA-dependent S-layer glycoprotein [Salinibaculum marinum]|uniref:HVO_2072 family ArtA-dependent S-layer glycoprotein n=1 Tax=Salinibaculum sp. GCM10025337 TaxID=3252686 RepID=UPI003A975B67